MDDAVRAYVDAIPAGFRPLFDRLDGLILETHPDVAVTMSYGMPTYKAGRRRLYAAVWKHGISLYGWQEGRDGGFAERHPELRKHKGTIQLTPEAGAAIADGELRDLIRDALRD